jgi:hypothetical protein
MKLSVKLKASALQFTVFISVLIALLLSGLVLYAYTFIYFKEQSKAGIENIQLADVAMQYSLKQSNTNNDTIDLDIVNKENQSVRLHTSQWGIFEKVFVKTQHRKKIFTKTSLVGSSFKSESDPTLFLQETYNPLSLVGKTKIKGIAYLPSQGVKSAYIAGESYYGSQLIYGKTEKSSLTLPKLTGNFKEQIQLYTKEYKPANQKEFITVAVANKIVNSFKKPTKSIFSSSQIILENKQISGNIIIKSEVSIKVKRTSLLKDLILIAPMVEIEDGTTGNFQVIATKKITVGKDCKLLYPSALVLFQDNKNVALLAEEKLENKIFIDSKSRVSGCVCYFQTKEILSDFTTQIILEGESKIKGQVYCEGSFELKGTVSGSIYTKQFTANQSGSVFVNHIYNGTIENENIPTVFGGILFDSRPKIVMKCLY